MRVEERKVGTSEVSEEYILTFPKPWFVRIPNETDVKKMLVCIGAMRRGVFV